MLQPVGTGRFGWSYAGLVERCESPHQKCPGRQGRIEGVFAATADALPTKPRRTHRATDPMGRPPHRNEREHVHHEQRDLAQLAEALVGWGPKAEREPPDRYLAAIGFFVPTRKNGPTSSADGIELAMPSRGCPVPPEGRRWGPAKSHCVNGFAGGPTVAWCSGSVVIVTGATNTAATAADGKRNGANGGPPTGDTSKAGRDCSITATGNGPIGSAAAGPA